MLPLPPEGLSQMTPCLAVQFLEDPFHSRMAEVIGPAHAFRSQSRNARPDGAVLA